MPTVHFIIKGKVQSVFYRATAKKMADKNGITGWVQNTQAGDVEIVASGAQPALHAFIEWCKKGPARAKVSDVIMAENNEEAFSEFVVRR